MFHLFTKKWLVQPKLPSRYTLQCPIPGLNQFGMLGDENSMLDGDDQETVIYMRSKFLTEQPTHIELASEFGFIAACEIRIQGNSFIKVLH